jgi:hypothetical protein
MLSRLDAGHDAYQSWLKRLSTKWELVGGSEAL